MKEESDMVREKRWDWTREIGTVSKWGKGRSVTEGQEGWHEAKAEKRESLDENQGEEEGQKLAVQGN